MDDDGSFFTHSSYIEHVGAESIRSVLAASLEKDDHSSTANPREVVTWITINSDPEIYFDQSSLAGPIGFGVDKTGALTVEIDVFLEDDAEFEETIPLMLEPLADEEHFSIEHFFLDPLDHSQAPPFQHHIQIRPHNLSDKTLRDLRQLGERIVGLCETLQPNAPIQTFVDHMKAGRAATVSYTHLTLPTTPYV